MRVLFVDDDPSILHGLRRMLRPMRQEWELDFASGGAEALALLERKPFDAVVSDMRMPGMDGGELLSEIQRLYPQIVRVVLSGQAEAEAIIRALPSTHQYLSKPCDPDTLRETLQRAFRVRRLLDDPGLRDVVTEIGTLPSLPSVYRNLIEECRSSTGSIQTVADLIGQDIGMTAQVLHLINSAFFGRQRSITDPLQAVQLLGLNTIKALALSAHVFAAFDVRPSAGFSLDTLQAHSLATAACTRVIVAAEQCAEELRAEATVAALLLDAGTLVLAARLPARYAAAGSLATSRSISALEAEREVFGTTHGPVGAYLLGLWGLPDAVVDAVAYHHAPSESARQTLSALTIVHAADAIVHELTAEDHPGGAPPPLDVEYLERIGIAHRLPEWRERFRADQEQGEP